LVKRRPRPAAVLAAALCAFIALSALTAAPAGRAAFAAQDPPFAAPRDLAASPGNCVVHLSWRPPPGEPLQDGLLGYRVYRSGGPGAGAGGRGAGAGGGGESAPGTGQDLPPVLVASLGPDVTEWLDYGVSNGRPYTYTVTAFYDDKVEVAAAAPVAATPRPIGLTVVLFAGEPSARVNGEEVRLDVPSEIVADRTMVPLRFVAGTLGADVQWEPAERQVTVALGSRVVRLWVGREEAELGGRPVAVDSPPVIRGGRTLVPVRFVSEALGARVDYDPVGRRVTLTYADTDGTPATAGPLRSGVPVRAALNGPDDVDHYRFRASPGQCVRLRTRDLTAGCDTVLTVLSLDGVPLASNDDRTLRTFESEVLFCPPATAAGMTTRAGPGPETTYLVRVQSAVPEGADPGGGYTIVLEACGGEAGHPRQALGVAVGGEPVRGVLTSASSRAWYRFTAEAGQVYSIRTSHLVGTGPSGEVVEGDTLLSLYAPDPAAAAAHPGGGGVEPWDGRPEGDWLVIRDDDAAPGPDGASEIRWLCRQGGRAYILVEAARGLHSPYVLTVSPLPGAGHRSSHLTAGKVVPDHQQAAGWLSSPDDEDWYAFEAAAGVRYHIQTFDLAPSCDTVLTLYAGDGQTVLAEDDDARGCGSLIEWTAPESGALYVRVTGWGHPRATAIGSYSFAVTTVWPENDNDPSYAAELRPGEPPLERSLVTGDRDWFRFEAVPGVTYTVETAALRAGCDTCLLLVDDGARLLAASDDIDYEGGNHASRVRWTASARGVVYVCVYPVRVGEARPGTGTYTIRLHALDTGAEP